MGLTVPARQLEGAAHLTAFVSQPLKMLTVRWMIEIVTIAVRRVTAFLLRTTQRRSPMPLCTSSLYRHACSSKGSCGDPVLTPYKIMIWIIGTTWPSGGCCLLGSSSFPIDFP